MKKFIKQGFLLGLLLLFAGNAWAFPVKVGDEVTMNYYGNADPSVPHPYFMDLGDGYGDNPTFCVEKTHTFNSHTKYKVASVGDIAFGGGYDEDGNYDLGDEISVESKWLFASWLDGAFDTYIDPDTGTYIDDPAKIVQEAIWYKENEDDSLFASWNLLSEGIIDFGITGWDIRVVNLVTLDVNGNIIEDNQSQLFAAPVPEPATMVLFGIGLIGLAGIGRRKVNK